jgi:hypothetical protein
MMAMLENHLPAVLEDAKLALEEEGIDVYGRASSIKEIPVEFTGQ